MCGLECPRNAKTGKGVRGQAGQITLSELHRSRGGAIEPAEKVESTRLAGAVRADHAGDMTRLRGERDVLHGANAAERDGEVRDVERRSLACHAKCSVRSSNRREGGRVLLGCRGKELRAELCDQAGNSVRCHAQHCEQQKAERKQAVFGQVRKQFGQQYNQQRTDDRPQRRSCPADHHAE